MTSAIPARLRREVSPLELFFDLVFVFAVSQLTHHLIAHLSWRSAAETLVLLVAVYGVWAFTSFEASMLDIERRGTQLMTVAVMGLGLFMNAGISEAFGTSPWLFVLPMLAALLGPSGYAAVTGSTPVLRLHFRRVLVWLGVSGTLWVVGSLVGPQQRLWWWSAAALVDFLGTVTAHPLPGLRISTEGLDFDAPHMLERMRLLLLILLGETVLSIGSAISAQPHDALVLGCGAALFVALVALWFLYFGAGDEVAADQVETTTNPIRAAHTGMVGLYAVMAGLVVLAGGANLVLAHAHDGSVGVGGILLLLGPALYLLAQGVFLARTAGQSGRGRLLAAAVLVLGAGAAYVLPAWAVVAALDVVLLVLAAAARNDLHTESGFSLSGR